MLYCSCHASGSWYMWLTLYRDRLGRHFRGRRPGIQNLVHVPCILLPSGPANGWHDSTTQWAGRWVLWILLPNNNRPANAYGICCIRIGRFLGRHSEWDVLSCLISTFVTYHSGTFCHVYLLHGDVLKEAEWRMPPPPPLPLRQAARKGRGGSLLAQLTRGKAVKFLTCQRYK